MTLLGACEAARKRIFWPTPRLKEGTLKALVPDQKKSELLRPWYSMAKLMQCSHRFSTNWCQHPLQSSSSSASMQRFHGSFLWLDSYLPSFFVLDFLFWKTLTVECRHIFVFRVPPLQALIFFFGWQLSFKRPFYSCRGIWMNAEITFPQDIVSELKFRCCFWWGLPTDF